MIYERIGFLEPGGDEALEQLPEHLRAVLENDLMEAVGRMNPPSFEGLRAVCVFLYNFAPSDCHGSPAVVYAWLERARQIKERAAQEAAR